MGNYYNPPDDVKRIGRPLRGSGDYANLIRQVGTNEVLVGLYDRIMFKNAPYLDCEAEFQEFQKQVDAGIIFLDGFFAVPKEAPGFDHKLK